MRPPAGEATLGALIGAARAELRRAGVPNDDAELDARLLARHVLGWDSATLLTSTFAAPPAGFAAAYEALVARRARREPLAYLTGEREFWNRPFEVSPAVLVPRPETELIVEAALEYLNGHRRADLQVRRPLPLVADVGTGSGCLAVTLACECAGLRVVATDVSEAALAVARRNAERHGVPDRVRFVQADLLDAGDEPYTLIVSNPPYVPDGERQGLPPEVRDFEPPTALFAGPDGLDVIRRLVALAPGRLVPAGQLIFEIGAGQAGAVAALISNTPGLTMVDLRRDLQGIERTAIARRR